MTKACLRDATPFGVCLIREGHEVGQPAAPHAVGCLARIEQWDVPHPNLFAVLARGGDRFRIIDTTVGANGLITGRIATLPEPTQPAAVDRACREVLRLAIERAGADSVPGPLQLDNPLWVSYRLAKSCRYHLPKDRRCWNSMTRRPGRPNCAPLWWPTAL